MNPAVGQIARPPALNRFGNVQSGAIGVLLNLFFNIIIVAGAVYAVFNFLLAGYAFMSAGSDAKKIADAWAKIYQTAIGLAFLSGGLVLGAIFGQLIFGSATFLLQPAIPTV